MSCLMTSATRRSRIVPDAVLIASAAASSHEVPLVPMISVTLYTLMAFSLDGCLARRRDAQQVHTPSTPGAGPDWYARRLPPDPSLTLSPGAVQSPQACRSASVQ